MNAISAIRRTTQERVDGTLVVKLEIEPRYVQDFFRLFPQMDMQVAIAPLIKGLPEPEQAPAASPVDRAKGGELAKLAGRWCADPVFLNWLADRFDDSFTSSEAALLIRTMCEVDSRANLDHDELAAEKFHKIFRKPYMDYLAKKVAA